MAGEELAEGLKASYESGENGVTDKRFSGAGLTGFLAGVLGAGVIGSGFIVIGVEED